MHTTSTRRARSDRARRSWLSATVNRRSRRDLVSGSMAGEQLVLPPPDVVILTPFPTCSSLSLSRRNTKPPGEERHGIQPPQDGGTASRGPRKRKRATKHSLATWIACTNYYCLCSKKSLCPTDRVVGRLWGLR